MDITITRGDSYTITFGVMIDNKPYELKLGDKLYFTAKKHVRCSDCVLSKSSGGGEIVYNPTTQKYEFDLTGNCSCNISYEKLLYDIELVFADGTVKTLQSGNLVINPDITRPCNREGN